MRTVVIILVGSIVGAIIGGIAGGIVGLLFMLFQPAPADAGTVQASYYGSELAGSPTACSGTPYNPSSLTAAHKSLPCGTRLLVRHEGRGVVVTVDDRGPFVAGRDLDLSEGAAQAIGLVESGAGPVEVEQVESSSANGEKLPETGRPK